jgi:ribosome modulation factor
VTKKELEFRGVGYQAYKEGVKMDESEYSGMPMVLRVQWIEGWYDAEADSWTSTV